MVPLAYAILEKNNDLILHNNRHNAVPPCWSDIYKTINCRHTRYTQSKAIVYITPPTHIQVHKTQIALN